MVDQSNIRRRNLAWFGVPVVIAIAIAFSWPRARAYKNGLYYCSEAHPVAATGQTILECHRDRRSPADRPVMINSTH